MKKRLSALILALFVLLAAAGCRSTSAPTFSYFKVDAPTISVYSSPGDDSELVDVLQRGDIVPAAYCEDEWVPVYTLRGAKGYIKTKYLKRFTTTDEYFARPVVCAVREEADLFAFSDGSSCIGSLSAGEEITLLGKSGEFSLLRTAAGMLGYAASSSLLEEYSPLPGCDAPGIYEVMASIVRIYPDADLSGEAIFTLNAGCTARVLGISGNAAQVETATGITGWCLKDNLRPGSSPEPALSVVDTSDPIYSPARLQADLKKLCAAYPEYCRVEHLGQSAFGNSIDVLVIGSDSAEKKVFVQGAIHGREYMNAQLAAAQCELYLSLISSGGSYLGTRVSEIFDKVQLWVLPMSNPDGCALSQSGLDALPEDMQHYADDLIDINDGKPSFARWKANGLGTDPNLNFDADWKVNGDCTAPASAGYSGTAPFSEIESQILRDLTLREQFDLSISYHSTGSMIYWYYGQQGKEKEQHLNLAREMAALTSYSLVSAEDSMSSWGGYKDWVIKELGTSSLTIETGSMGASAPFGADYFPDIWEKNAYGALHACLMLIR